MADEKNAVFLSYASQDAQAAYAICEALRAVGIEVFLDQSELRSGDAWDQKIRTQIRDCELFLPIISKNTQARAEGYFRLEWGDAGLSYCKIDPLLDPLREEPRFRAMLEKLSLN